MQKRLISILILIAYSAILIKVMVFKDVPLIRIGQLMLNFGGTDGAHPPNFVPFVTIVPYLLGYKGWIIAGINLVGNIALLVPLGFLVILAFPNMSWKKSLVIAFASGLIIEVMQTVLRVGIFDIDDVILNAIGFMIGYGAFILLTKWIRERKYIHISIVAIIGITAAAGALYAIYPHGQPVVNPGVDAISGQNEDGQVPQTGDLCGGTGGNGQIISIGNNSVVMERGDSSNQVVNFTGQTTINTPTGVGSISDLKKGDRLTLVGGPNSDGSFTADAVFVCTKE